MSNKTLKPGWRRVKFGEVVRQRFADLAARIGQASGTAPAPYNQSTTVAQAY